MSYTYHDNFLVPLNLVWVSGMHGSGKDTVINNVLSAPNLDKLPYKVLRYKKCEMTSFDDLFERQTRRIAKYGIDWYRSIGMAIKNPDSIVLADRCYHDARCYIEGFYYLDWLTEKQQDWLLDILDEQFALWSTEDIKPFLLYPPLSHIEKNLETRHEQTQSKKWREEDEEYNKAIYDSYTLYFTDDSDYHVFGEDAYEEYDIPEFEPGYKCTATNMVDQAIELQKYMTECWEKFMDSDQPMMMERKQYDWFHPIMEWGK